MTETMQTSGMPFSLSTKHWKDADSPPLVYQPNGLQQILTARELLPGANPEFRVKEVRTFQAPIRIVHARTTKSLSSKSSSPQAQTPRDGQSVVSRKSTHSSSLSKSPEETPRSAVSSSASSRRSGKSKTSRTMESASGTELPTSRRLTHSTVEKTPSSAKLSKSRKSVISTARSGASSAWTSTHRIIFLPFSPESATARRAGARSAKSSLAPIYEEGANSRPSTRRSEPQYEFIGNTNQKLSSQMGQHPGLSVKSFSSRPLTTSATIQGSRPSQCSSLRRVSFMIRNGSTSTRRRPSSIRSFITQEKIKTPTGWLGCCGGNRRVSRVIEREHRWWMFPFRVCMPSKSS